MTRFIELNSGIQTSPCNTGKQTEGHGATDTHFGTEGRVNVGGHIVITESRPKRIQEIQQILESDKRIDGRFTFAVTLTLIVTMSNRRRFIMVRIIGVMDCHTVTPVNGPTSPPSIAIHTDSTPTHSPLFSVNIIKTDGFRL